MVLQSVAEISCQILTKRQQLKWLKHKQNVCMTFNFSRIWPLLCLDLYFILKLDSNYHFKYYISYFQVKIDQHLFLYSQSFCNWRYLGVLFIRAIYHWFKLKIWEGFLPIFLTPLFTGVFFADWCFVTINHWYPRKICALLVPMF